jgi:hypothetical protein
MFFLHHPAIIQDRMNKLYPKKIEEGQTTELLQKPPEKPKRVMKAKIPRQTNEKKKQEKCQKEINDIEQFNNKKKRTKVKTSDTELNSKIDFILNKLSLMEKEPKDEPSKEKPKEKPKEEPMEEDPIEEPIKEKPKNSRKKISTIII